MSLPTVTDFLFGDLMTELNLKPWWEKLRGYCFAASVVCALFLTYITVSLTTIGCIPLNTTAQAEFSTAQANFVNVYCAKQLPWYVRLVGVISMFFSLIIVCASNYWTVFPDVRNSFRTFSKFAEAIDNLNLTPSKVCDLSSEIINSSTTHEVRQVRNACCFLWRHYDDTDSVIERYSNRNIILFFTTAIIAILSFILFYCLVTIERTIECSFTSGDENESEWYLCSYNTSEMIYLLVLAYIIFVFAQWCAVVAAKKTYKNNKISANLSNKGRKAAAYSWYMENIWANSDPVRGRTFEQLIEHIFDDALTKIKANLERAISEDIEIVCVYATLRKNGGADVFTKVNKILKRNNFVVTDICHDNIVKCFGFLKPKLPIGVFFDFVLHLCKHKYWELLANILVANLSHYVANHPSDTEELEGVKINLNEIGQPYETRRSLLFYILSEKLKNTDGAQFIIKSLTKETRKFYVHDNGKTKRLSSLSPSPCLPGDLHSEGSLSIAEMYWSKILIIDDFEYFRDLYDDHVTKTERYKDEMNRLSQESGLQKLYAYLKELSENISRHKFDEWEVNTRKLASYANSEKQWIIFVALLNAFIADEYDLLEDIGCGVNKFTDVEHNAESDTCPLARILYHALQKPSYEPEIQFTAVRHILGCSIGQEKNVREHNGSTVSAVQYVKENKDLDEDEKKTLLRYLMKSMNATRDPGEPQNETIGISQAADSIPSTSSNVRCHSLGQYTIKMDQEDQLEALVRPHSV